MRVCIRLVPIVIIFLLSACFFGGKEPVGSIRGYKSSVVLLKQGSYRVGELGQTWSRLLLKQKTLAFRAPDKSATIATNAFCGENFDDAPLEVLARHLYIGVEGLNVESQKELVLDGRRALSTVWNGRMDGVPVKLETVSVKKDECLFDFYYITSPSADTFARHRADFERFAGGFAYP